MDRIRSELFDAYRRIEHTLAGQTDQGEFLTRTMVDAAIGSVDRSAPTWLSAEIVDELIASVGGLVDTEALIGGGQRGFLLFEKPVCSTTLGAAGSLGIAPINGLIWWAADLDGHDFHQDADHPNLVVVHALSTFISTEAPWSPALWSDSTLTDLGMFPLPLGMVKSPPTVADDDLAPAIRLLLGYGAAMQSGRILFDDVGPGSPNRCAPRRAAVVYEAVVAAT